MPKMLNCYTVQRWGNSAVVWRGRQSRAAAPTTRTTASTTASVCCWWTWMNIIASKWCVCVCVFERECVCVCVCVCVCLCVCVWECAPLNPPVYVTVCRHWNRISPACFIIWFQVEGWSLLLFTEGGALDCNTTLNKESQRLFYEHRSEQDIYKRQ